jgi:Kef-type K+ transport system membrane component KefB
VSLLAAGQPWQVATMLGALAIETAAASTLMVLRECNASGPLTETLTGVFALDNVLCLMLVNILISGVQFHSHPGPVTAELLYDTVVPFTWSIVGALALGYIVGFLLAAWSSRVVEHGEQLILLAGCVLLCVGFSSLLHVSAMVTNLTVGATLVNLSERSRRFLESLSKTDPPLYAIFFVLAGAELNVGVLATLGIPGAIYIAGRLIGKIVGATVGATITGAPVAIRRRLPFSMGAQAGLAIGLTLVIQRRLPDWAPGISAVVLAAVIVFEIIGPLGVRWMILRAGEAHPETEAPEY